MKEMQDIVCDLRCLKKGNQTCCEQEGCEHYNKEIGCLIKREDRPDRCLSYVCYCTRMNLAH